MSTYSTAVSVIHRCTTCQLSIRRMTLSRWEIRRPLGLLRRRSAAARAVASLNIIDNDILEVGRDRGAAQRHRLFAVNEYRRRRLLAGAGQRDSNVGVL